MSSKLLITTRLDQKLAINQQVTQAIQLLQYSTIELEAVIQAFIEQNPLVELQEAEDENATFVANESYRHSSIDDENKNYIENLPETVNLRNYLLQQSYDCHFNETEQSIAEAIIDNIDDNGYLSIPLESLEEKFDKSQLEAVYNCILNFEPIGVGSRTIRESLIKQLKMCVDLDKSVIETGLQILELDDQDCQRFDLNSIAKMINRRSDDVLSAISAVKKLNINPGLQYKSNDDRIYPELYVKQINGDWKVFLKDGLSNRLIINSYYKNLIKDSKKNKDYQSLKKMLSEAQMMLSGIKKRNETLLKVASYIIKEQQDFLLKGKEYIKQLTMMDVAREVECHESTVSRIVNKKYIQLPMGVFELRYFFSSSISASYGVKKSSKSVQAIIEDILKSEVDQKVYSDEQILLILKSKNISISRRTVAKYRKLLGIPSSYERAVANTLKPKKEEQLPDNELEIA